MLRRLSDCEEGVIVSKPEEVRSKKRENRKEIWRINYDEISRLRFTMPACRRGRLEMTLEK